VRYLWDQAGTPVVLCGSKKLQLTLTVATQRYPELDQLHSRVTRQLILRPLLAVETKNFVLAAFREEELGDLPERVIATFHSRSRGVTRTLVNALKTARRVLELNKRGALSEKLVNAAFDQHVVM